jgi:hypothetical protein
MHFCLQSFEFPEFLRHDYAELKINKGAIVTVNPSDALQTVIDQS